MTLRGQLEAHAGDCARRLALGTAQFGQRYGVANTSGPVVAEAVAAITALARERGIDTLDTAVAYGDSETVLGSAGVTSWRVVSKLPPLPADTADVDGWVQGQVSGSLQRLHIERLDGLLLHNSADAHGPRGPQLLRALAALKSSNRIGAAGISIYDPAELDALWPTWRPDILQAPYSVLDRRLLQSGWLARLQDEGTRLHVRSVFLQGLLLMPAAHRPPFFARWRALLDRWLEWCRAQAVAPLTAALAFTRTLPGVERVVIGVDSCAQLRAILEAARCTAPLPPDDLCSTDSELLEPWRWRVA